jgi:hypothetical protein
MREALEARTTMLQVMDLHRALRVGDGRFGPRAVDECCRA